MKVNVIIIVLFFTSCTNKHEREQSQQFFVPDSLWATTGDAQLDSLLHLATITPPDTNLAMLYYDIGYTYYFSHGNPQKATDYYEKMKALSEKLNWNEGHYLFVNSISEILNATGLMDSSIVLFQQTLELAKSEMNEYRIATTLTNLGVCFYRKSWYETALEYYHQAIPLFEKQGNTFPLAHVYNLTGILYGEMSLLDEHLMYLEKALELTKETSDLKRANWLNNYSIALMQKNELEKAENCLVEAQRISMLHNDIFFLGRNYLNFVDIELHKFDLDKAEMYLKKAKDIFLEMDDVSGLCSMQVGYAQVEFYRGNFSKSEEYTREALEKAIEHDFSDIKKICYRFLANLAITRHDFKNHKYYNDKTETIQNEMISEKSREYAKEMAAKYETEKKELEIERQQQVIARQNMQRWLLAVGVVVCVVFLALLWYMLRLRNRRNRALAEMNATKDKFFSIISHDLKNPAVSQRDAIQLLVKNARLWDADTLTDYYNELLKSAEGEVELIYNLLGWAQIQTGRMTFTPETVLLSDLLPDISLIRKMAENKDITLTVSMPDHALVTGDSNILATVIRNLLNNAVKFTTRGGQVSLTVESTGSGRYTFAVSDTGVGMSKEQLHELFRIDSPHHRRGTAGEQGSGLGLIVCRDLLEKHGSTLRMESDEGKGSRFWFEL